jgi:hypothetical protein
MQRSLAAIIATIALFLFAGQALADTLVLSNGTAIPGELLGATSKSVTFRGTDGVTHVYGTSEIETLKLSRREEPEFRLASSREPAATETTAASVNKTSDSALIQQLLQRVAQLESSVKALQNSPAQNAVVSSPIFPAIAPKETEKVPDAPQSPGSDTNAGAAAKNQEQSVAPREHTMEIPGFGPALKIRGFLDLNFGLGDVANPLISPLGAPGHATFQEGEFDLFITSKLARNFDFLSEVVIGSDATNEFGLDIERLMFQYKPSDYFQLAAGRYHTSIGYYSTAFHHGTWFQKATGRPFLFLFEDSGGILPVHSVGISTTGLLPKTGKLNLHWVAEVGNGRRSSNPSDQPVQNFLDENDHKAFNLAVYIKPDWISGTQFGGSYYRDRLTPNGLPHINQSISSAYAVYSTPQWELLNEAVLLRHKPDGGARLLNTPGFYSQIARRVARNYWPYFRYQYVNVPKLDLVNPTVGRQNGPSAGIRWDFTDYAALKVQYNRLYQRGAETKNGLDTQVAFTF